MRWIQTVAHTLGGELLVSAAGIEGLCAIIYPIGYDAHGCGTREKVSKTTYIIQHGTRQVNHGSMSAELALIAAPLRTSMLPHKAAQHPHHR
jgi:hypothetical protein